MKPVAYIYPSDLARIAAHPMTCTAYPDQVRCAEECTIPLFTLAQVREFTEARTQALLEELASANACTHDDTFRGGAIWTICNQCGMKWADDEGGPPWARRAKEQA